jgi:hypothetical protein
MAGAHATEAAAHAWFWLSNWASSSHRHVAPPNCHRAIDYKFQKVYMPRTLSLMTFNVNNLFFRYKFGSTFPGDMSSKSASPDPRWGYLSLFKPGLFEISKTIPVSFRAIAWRLNWPCPVCIQFEV